MNNFDLARQHADKMIPNADYNVAFKLFNQVLSESPNPLAMIYLGALYCAGKGTERDSKKGSELIKKGMSCNKEKLEPNFCFRLGMLFYDGRVEALPPVTNLATNGFKIRKQELQQAVQLFRTASAGGVTKAKEYIVKSQQEIKKCLEKYISEAWKDILRWENHMLIYYKDSGTRELIWKLHNEIKEAEQELKNIEDSTYDW